MNSLIQILTSKSVQDYIRQNEHTDALSIALKKNIFDGVPSPAIAQQIEGRQKSKDKIPCLHNADGIIYPPGINLEQSSSEITARYKARILMEYVNADSTIVDLTGGFGIDTFFFSQIVSQVTHIEPDEYLSQVARHNHLVLGASNIRYFNLTAELYLSTNATNPDVFFIDPSRRDDKNKKVFLLTDTVPDITTLLPSLLLRSRFVLIKTSPLLDIKQAISQLSHVKAIHVVAVKNECKELLILCDREFNETPLIHSVNISGTEQHFNFTFEDESDTNAGVAAEVERYLYEPNAAILKAGAFKSIAKAYDLQKLHVSTHLYTSTELNQNFPGRIFEIQHEVKSDPRAATQAFPNKKVNIVTRNYPLTPEKLKQKLKLQDGGEHYLLGMTIGENRKVLFKAIRLQ